MQKLISRSGASVLSCIAFSGILFSCSESSKDTTGDTLSDTPAYKNASLPVDERVSDLLGRMTLEEKVAQTLCIWDKKKQLLLDSNYNFSPEKADSSLKNGIGQIARPYETDKYWHFKTPAQTAVFNNEVQKFLLEKTRLGIPAIMHFECLHGIQAGNVTSFPQPIGLACSWNPELIENIYTYVAKESRAMGGHVALTPVLDVAREPRWGRVEETYGEDPYLNGVMGLACINGFQGRDVTGNFAPDRIGATMKHFAAHGQPEGGTNIAPVNVSERVLREVHFPPFKKAVIDGKVLSVMASYNEIDGVPSHANKWLLDDVLRKEWGFNGYVVSDYFAIKELQTRHAVAADSLEAARLALEAGVDNEMPDIDTYANIPELIKSGRMKEAVLDSAVARILRAKFRLGLFENPYVANPEEADQIAGSDAGRALALQAAKEAVVLLKNHNNTLPLDISKIKTLAVIGPNAIKNHQGGYSGDSKYKVSLLDGIKEKLAGKVNVLYAKGCMITVKDGDWWEDDDKPADEATDRKLIAEAVQVARKADVIVLSIGGNETTAREAWGESHPGDRTDLNLFGRQDDLVRALLPLGKPIIAVLTNGGPLVFNLVSEKVPAILETWYLGQEQGHAVADILFGDYNPAGKLTISFPRSVGHLPAYYSQKPTAKRCYLFDSTGAKYPFGYGLSYSTFEISEPVLENATIKLDSGTKVTVTVKNTGNYDGAEVVQMYIRDKSSSVTRPVKELKGFKKVFLKAGESAQVSIDITPETLAFWDINMKYVVEPGDFDIMVGNSSVNLKSVKLTVQ